jgi:hypothetical protein
MIEAITLMLRSLCTTLLIEETSYRLFWPPTCGPMYPERSPWKNGSQSRGYNIVSAPRLMGHRFPAKLEMLILSNATSVGRESAYATALETSSGEIILWRGHFPSI